MSIKKHLLIALSLMAAMTPSLLPAEQQGSSSETLMQVEASLPWHTVYRLRHLSAADTPLPLVVFGNGLCRAVGNMYEPFLRFVAAQGYLVIAGGPIVPNQADHSREEDQWSPQTRLGHMAGAIDWAMAQNANEHSIYHGWLDLEHIALMGHSCGGLEAIGEASDPRVTTALILNSGIIRGGIDLPDGGMREPIGYFPAREADLAELHTPMLYIAGGTRDFAYRAAEEDFETVNHVPLFYGNRDTGHGGTWFEPDGGDMATVVVDWLDWQLKGNEKAAQTFTGPDCGLCVDPAWTIKKKQIP